MKTIVLWSILPLRGILCCLLLYALLLAGVSGWAQTTAGPPKAAPQTKAHKKFFKGDAVPDLEFRGIGPKGRTLRLSDLKGKLVILDFWGTWCGACLSRIPEMEKLQRQYGNRLAIIMITGQEKKLAESFLAKLGNGKLPGLLRVSGDTVWANVFKHRTIPHYVVIDQAGRYLIETGVEPITPASIDAMLAGHVTQITQKRDTTTQWDRKLLLFDQGNGGPVPKGSYGMVFSKYVPGLSGRYIVRMLPDSSVSRLTMTNLSIPRLFGYAHSARKVNFDYRRMLFLCKDITRLHVDNPSEEWIGNNMYCYELIVPKSMEAQKFEIAVNDLNRFFPEIAVTRELMWRKCLVLVRTSDKDKIRTKGGTPDVKADLFAYDLTNHSIMRFISEMDIKFLQGQAYSIIDGTNYTAPVDLSLRANLSDLNEVNKALALYDLKFEQREQEIEMLVFRDREPSTTNTKTLKP